MSREERVYNVGRKLKFTLTEDHLIEDVEVERGT